MKQWPAITCVFTLLWTAVVPATGLSVAFQSRASSANVAANGTHSKALVHRSASHSSREPPQAPAAEGLRGNAQHEQLSGEGQPRLFFLFMVYTKILNQEIWDKFFDSAVQGVDYRALVHCKSTDECRKEIKSQHRFEIIQSVKTEYCFDLVSGMNALLKAALSYSGHQENAFDKFIFLSDSTLPVKPFHIVKHRLVTQDSNASSFCIFPRNDWAEISSSSILKIGHVDAVRVAVKHHQWIILSRTHAKVIVDHASVNFDLMSQFKMNEGARNFGCLDEFWHFATLFGTVELHQKDGPVPLQGFSGGPLMTGMYEPQGQCDTFVHWMPRAAGVVNNQTRFVQVLENDPGVDFTPANFYRPGLMHRFSKQSLTAFRDSWFLFARKVDEKAELAGCARLDDAFEKLVFSEPAQVMAPEPAWLGQGTWLDTQNTPVTITSIDGMLVIQSLDNSMSGKGSYCNDKIKVIFSDGYHATATLSPDSSKLKWNTGMSWHRNVVR